MPLTLEEKVAHTAAFLDKQKPEWAILLVAHYGNDLAGLYVDNPARCVLSAVYGDYSDGWHAMKLNGLGNFGDAIACHNYENDKLRALWLTEVNKRSVVQ